MNTTESINRLSFYILGFLMITLKSGNAQEVNFQELLVDVDYAEFVTHIWTPKSRNAETIIALPGSGADVSRYKYIGPLLAKAGYKLVAINQRGILGSSGNLEGITLRDLARDVVTIADKLGINKFHMVGWAFGNRTSRMLATIYPERLTSLILIAAGGLVPALTQPGELAEFAGGALAAAFITEENVMQRRMMSPPIKPTVDKTNGLYYSWNKWRGPGEVTFDPPQVKVWEDTRTSANSPWGALFLPPPIPEDGIYKANATFTEPGEYILWGRADDGRLYHDAWVTVNVSQ